MMRTSATGRAEGRYRSPRGGSLRERRSRAGFTLVELLMVVAIMGLAASAVVLAVPDPRPPVGDEAERFAARLVRAREEALLTNRAVAVEATAGGYAFSSFDGVQWSPLTDGPFAEERWAEETAARPEGQPADTPLRVVFDPTGVADAARLTLSRGPRAVTVAIDAAGEVKVDG
ncbi:GspH/FimT family pseudopilin [Brevundimonas sp.]|uniref:GspH/FimT family pseudopilin n=1 Tax=Brevundimonas sp. TaxID=1871086 RepID=UPI0028A983E1|nr:GspH/FimT family pseudopilin [Brevundimonas sp.]